MPQFSSRIALLAVAGVLAVASPAFAAPNGGGSNPNMNNNSGSSAPIDCTLPANQQLRYCLMLLNKNGGNGSSSSSYNRGSSSHDNSNDGSNSTDSSSRYHNPNDNNNNDNNNGNNDNNNGYGGNNDRNYHGPRSGSFDFSQQDRSQFHQRFHGFNFGNFSFFFTPSFRITIGTTIPHTYRTHLRPVPSSIYRYYPWFRGYFYFTDRAGDFVIVSPSNFHIIAVL